MNEPEERDAPRLDRPVHDESGVDLTLIRWMLGLSYRERLEVLQAQADSLDKLRDAATRS